MEMGNLRLPPSPPPCRPRIPKSARSTISVEKGEGISLPEPPSATSPNGTSTRFKSPGVTIGGDRREGEGIGEEDDAAGTTQVALGREGEILSRRFSCLLERIWRRWERANVRCWTGHKWTNRRRGVHWAIKKCILYVNWARFGYRRPSSRRPIEIYTTSSRPRPKVTKYLGSQNMPGAAAWFRTGWGRRN
ncbi:hypothetical protein Salat_1192300 [Sesamum alatum]|uniref:Uncharacterized protein n=1 Tax=Sesamum alatum TaxID=300844 RepID=A0AAE1YG29_9LAMI|nr:hypothetical protein Salat_1192300 [Sesamum alatum]